MARHSTGSAKQRQFSVIPSPTVPRSLMDRSEKLKTTFRGGLLIPIMAEEILPGDTVSLSHTQFGRFATLATSPLDNAHLEFFWFACPLRILWDHFVNMMGEKVNPSDSTEYTVPQISPPAGGWTSQTLSDYLDIPPLVEGLDTTALFHRCYARIYNDWFRAGFLQDSVYAPTGDGPDDPTQYPLRRRGKRFDYFTACNPFPQAGPPVEIPLVGSAPVIPDPSGPIPTFLPAGGVTPSALWSQGSGIAAWAQNPVATPAAPAAWSATGLLSDLSAASSITINALREAATLQQAYEIEARGGQRYTEQVRSYFGVVSPDARLQRPELLHVAHESIDITSVAQTSSTDATSPQANIAAFGTIGGSTRGFTKSFTEHSILMGLVSLRADLSYQQGLHKKFSRKEKFDFYFPPFANLGEQAVLNKEIYAQGSAGTTPGETDDDVFGYIPRWDEYRWGKNRITGLFRSQVPLSLDVWTFAEEFSELPKLNDTFIQDNPPFDRVVTTTSPQPHVLLDVKFDFKVARPMPTNSVPGITRL